MSIAISSIGLATAQGGVAEISSSTSLRAAEQWPWPVNGWCTSLRCRPAAGVSPNLSGIARWRALVRLALKDCFGDQRPSATTPIFVGSCNGSAGDFSADSWAAAFDSTALLEGTAWAGHQAPVFSSSCNSGLHALYGATRVLLSGQADEAVVVAADILSRSNQDNFEVLRVLTDSPMRPWQPISTGFVLGEAAVVLRLVRAKNGMPALTCPVLANELTPEDGLHRVLEPLSRATPRLLLGQGSGPFAADESELRVFQRFVAAEVPLATPMVHFGHTLGASGLLGVALAALIQRNSQALEALRMPNACASDGRPLVNRTFEEGAGNNHGRGIDNILVSCRALNGSCAAAVVGSAGLQQDEQHHLDVPLQKCWHAPVPIGPLMNLNLRRIADEAPRHRPAAPPDVLLVRLEEPLSPPPEARIGNRLLPSAVLEMTPGFVSQLVARCWGFAGPALCVVEKRTVRNGSPDLVAAMERNGLVSEEVNLLGTGDKRELVWNK